MHRLVIFYVTTFFLYSQIFGSDPLARYLELNPGQEMTVQAAQCALGKEYTQNPIERPTPTRVNYGRTLLVAVARQSTDLKAQADAFAALTNLSSTLIDHGNQYIMKALGNRSPNDIQYGRELLEQEAKQIDTPYEQAAAQFLLGYGYLEGLIGNRLPKDLKRGLRYTQRASDQSTNRSIQAGAHAVLGVHLLENDDNDYRTQQVAMRHLHSAARQQANLGARALGQFGLGLTATNKQDYRTALKQFSRVTEKDHPLAYLRSQGFIGQMYAAGFLGQANKEKADHYLCLIAQLELPQLDPTRKHLPPLLERERRITTIMAARRKLMERHPRFLEENTVNAIPDLEAIEE